jgi:enamine deaminase RidA (YjgF/YER057c/UK114 family)
MLVRAARRAAVASAAAPRRCTARRTSTVGDNRVVRLQTEDPRMSKIVIHNGVVYTSGQTAGDAGDCVKAQTQATLDKVDALLKEAGTSKSHALSATIWLKDINRDFKGMNEVWNAWVDPENKPVRATVEAAMAREILLVEIQVTAALDKNPFEDLNY